MTSTSSIPNLKNEMSAKQLSDLNVFGVLIPFLAVRVPSIIIILSLLKTSFLTQNQFSHNILCIIYMLWHIIAWMSSMQSSKIYFSLL